MSDSAGTGAAIKPAGVAALVLGGVFSAMALVAASVLLPGMAHEFAATPNIGLLVQLVGAMVPAALALGAPIAGRLVDRFGYRSVFLGGLIAFALTGTLPTFLHDMYLILASRVALGCSTAAILIGLLSGIGTLPEARRAKLLGFQTFTGGVAAMLLYPLLAIVAKHGWRPGFLVHLLAFALIPLVLTLPRGVRGASHAETGAGRGRVISPVLVGVAIAIGMVMFIGGVFTPLYLPSIGVTNPSLWAIPPMVGAALGLIFSASYGWLHGRMSIKALFATALGLTGVGLLVSGLSNDLALFTLGGAFTGSGLALFTPSLSAAAIAYSGPGQSGRAVGLANGAFFCSQVIFPFISTPLSGLVGLRGIYLVFAGVCLLIALGYGLSLFRRSGRLETTSAPAG